MLEKQTQKKNKSSQESTMAKWFWAPQRMNSRSSLFAPAGLKMSLIIFGILTFRRWHEWKHNKCEPTEQPCTLEIWLVPLFVSSHRGLAVVYPSAERREAEELLSPPQHPVSALTQNVGYVGRWSGGLESARWAAGLASLSLHRILMWGGIPVRVPGHVAVGRHVYSFGRGRDVPYWRDGRGARG